MNTDTPETNEALAAILDKDGYLSEDNAPDVLVKLSRTMERERDQWRNEHDRVVREYRLSPRTAKMKKPMTNMTTYHCTEKTDGTIVCTPAKEVPSGGSERRLVVHLRRLAREILVVGLVAIILVISFWEVLTQDGKPWWAHILAWLAVWSTYDLMKLRSKSLHNETSPSVDAKEK